MKFSNGLKKAGIVLTFSLLVILQASAQKDSTARTPETRAKNLTEKMKTELSLTDDQYNPVYEINLKYARKNQEAMSGGSSRIAMAKALKSGNADKNKELKEILTKEQFEKYKSMQKELKSDAREAIRNRKGSAQDQ